MDFKLRGKVAGAIVGIDFAIADEHAPIKRFGTPEELADYFVLLCFERPSYSVGPTDFADGGMLKTLQRLGQPDTGWTRTKGQGVVY
ncbi:hypothetical protein Sa4125_38810 [Aureimonas sp. SA4125]|nr:hypothetical protein Sa4125_38810 [Aureimonas sp. SA4125]